MYKPVYYYSVMTGNRGDMAIRKSITEAISEKIKVPFAYFNLKYEELTKQRIINQLNNEASCLMIAGSGLYTNYPMSSGWYFPCKTELFNKIKVPIVLLGLGCNNNIGVDIFKGELTKETRTSIKKINDLSAYSTVRDGRTYDILSDIGVTGHELILDPGNFLKVNKKPKEKKVAINLAQHSPTLGRFDGDVKCREKNIKYFTEIINFLKNKRYKTVFIAHDTLEYSLIRDLKVHCPELEYLNTDNLDLMLEEYSRCEFSISMKMHSAIMSFASGTPAIQVYYDQKSIEYAKLIGFDNYQVCVFDDYLEPLKNKINIMIDHIEEITDSINNIRTLGEVNFNKGIEKICKIIKTTV